MLEINGNLTINLDSVVSVNNVQGKWIVRLRNGSSITVTEEIANEIITSTGGGVSSDVKEYVDGTLENYAKKDGYYETFGYAREAGIAKNLQNDEGKLLDPDVTTSGGTVYADQPFTQRATAMTMKAYIDNELITVGSGYEQWRKEQAFSIVRNQVVPNLNSTNWRFHSAAGSISNGVATFTATSRYGNVNPNPQNRNILITPGHKYLIIAEINNAVATTGVVLRIDYGSISGYKETTAIAGWQTVSFIHTATESNNNGYVYVYDNRTSDWAEISTRNIKCIDLTQWFASRPEIATALNGDAGVKWFLQNYPEALTLGYDEGTIVDTEDYDYETTGVNLWDEEWEVGAFDTSTGANISNNQVRSKNPINVFPNTEYYFNPSLDIWVMFLDMNMQPIPLTVPSGYYLVGNSVRLGNADNKQAFKTPNNAAYCKFYCQAGYGETYKNDIQICQHFTETSVEQTYHKYEIFKDRVSWAFTSTGKGKSAGLVADTKDYVNKKNIEKVGQIDLGTLNWSYDSTNELFYTTELSTICKKVRGNAFTSSIYTNSGVKTLSSMLNLEGQFLDNGALYLKNTSYNNTSSFKSAMSGVILNYELATYNETDMSGDELNTNIPENDYGVERKVPVSGNMFSGSATTIFYQDNPLRQIYNNKSAIDNLQTDLSTEATTRSDTDTALQNAIGGTLRQCLCVKESLDFDNTDFVDLGTIELDTSTTSVDGLYRFTSTTLVGVAKGSSSNNTIAKCLCTKIKTNSMDNTYLCQTGIAISPSGSISIFVQGINNDNDMKTYLKGQLLAYEKASS